MFKKSKNKPKVNKPGQPLPDYQEYLKQKLQVDDPKELPSDFKILHPTLTKVFESSDDFTKKTMKLPSGQQVSLYYVKGLINKDQLQKWVAEPLIKHINEKIEKPVTTVSDVIQSAQLTEPKNWEELIQNCLMGQLICHIDGLKPVSVAINTSKNRNPSDPTTEYQVYGPKVGFVEDSMTNVAMVRKFITDPRLKVKEFNIGRLSHTHVALLYVDEYVDPDFLSEVIERLQKVTEDNVVSAGQLGSLIADYPNSLFPQAQKTERPDNASYALSQGKIVIILDNATFVLLLPTTHFDLYLTSEDNFLQPWHKLFIRALRMIGLITATIFPAFYVSLVAFHPELIPSTLAITIAETRNNIPFSASAEAFLMFLALDVLVESSMRLPMFVGQTVGIVGGLIIGQAAVEAGFVSSTMIIVTAFTAVASFTTPSWDLVSSVRIARYILLSLASMLGLFGLTIGLFLVLIHLCHLSSFSKPYLSPMTPMNPGELFHLFFRKITRKS
jgi:hypothetical protein